MLKYAIMSYIPQRYMRRADFDTQDTMRHLLDFKAGRKYATKWAADLVARTLAPMDLTNTIIVCIPASCEQTNKRRYKRFSASVCEKCKAINGFEHILVIGKRKKVHISKRHDHKSNVQIDTDYVNGKRVLLIDDICTTCATANAFIEQMQKAGADVRMTRYPPRCYQHRGTSLSRQDQELSQI
ncbi:MAG: phosphoribosyltransferase [Prevotella sp.]|nr:phosphoribosyltransferase [Prevotella sp.]